MKQSMMRFLAPALISLLCLALVPAGHAVEILRWERLPLAVLSAARTLEVER